MALPNLIALLALSPVIAKETKKYFKKVPEVEVVDGTNSNR